MDSRDDIGTSWDACNHEFEWTADHLTREETDSLLYTYDKLATDALDRIDELSPPPPKSAKSAKCPMSRDLYALVQQYADADETIGKLWKEISTVPDWVDWDQIERAQRVVYQYNGQIALGVSFNRWVISTVG